MLGSVMELCIKANQNIKIVKRQTENEAVKNPLTCERIQKWFRDKICDFLWPGWHIQNR